MASDDLLSQIDLKVPHTSALTPVRIEAVAARHRQGGGHPPRDRGAVSSVDGFKTGQTALRIRNRTNQSARRHFPDLSGLDFGVTITPAPSQWRVALMGIAQRQIQVKIPAYLGNQKRANALKINMKTAGDWLKVKRLEKNLTPGQVAAKMGIATSLVCSWEGNTQQPDNHQLKVLASVLDFDAKDFEKVTSTP